MKRVVIVGGGISGLATALHLQDRASELAEELEVIVLEAGTQPGGNIATDRVDGFTIENGPNGYLDNVAATRDLVTRLGLDGELQVSDEAAAKRYLYRFGKLHYLAASPIGFFRSGVLTLKGRMRVAMEPFARKRSEGKDETVFEFASRRIGPEAAAVLVDSMVSGVFAGNAKELSLQSTFPKMFAMEGDHGGLVKAMIAKMRAAKAARKRGEIPEGGGPAGPGGTLTSFRNGLDTLPNKLAETLGDTLHLGSGAQSIVLDEEADKPWTVSTTDGKKLSADAILVTVPAPRAALILETFDTDLAANISQIVTSSLAVVALAYDAEAMGGAPDGFGFLVPRGAGPRILGCLWDSSIFPGRAPEGKVLMRAMIGGRHDLEALDLDDDTLLSIVRQDLETTMGLSVDPLWTRIYRYPLGIGQYRVGHQDLLDRVHSRLADLPGIWIGGSSYYGVAMNACFQKAPEQAEEILSYLKSS